MTIMDPKRPCGCSYTELCPHDGNGMLGGSRYVDLKKASTAVIPEPTAASKVESTLSERGSRYGDFSDNSKLSQQLEETIRSQSGYQNLSYLHREAIKFIFQKISRIVNGDPNYRDNWHDIQGYAKLVEDRLKDYPGA